MTERKIVQCLNSFFPAGSPLMIEAKALYYSDDPVVRSHPDAFGDAEIRSSVGARTRTPMSSGSVETASAEPGARRRMTRSRVQEVNLTDSGTADTVTTISEV